MQTFEEYIKSYLNKKYGSDADELYNLSYLLQYLVYKTKSENRGAKARGSFANLYAIYVLVEDYIQKYCCPVNILKKRKKMGWISETKSSLSRLYLF